jgi:hypothetical protein
MNAWAGMAARCVAGAAAAIGLSGCDAPGREWASLARIPVGEAVRFNQVFDHHEGVVCTLFPMADRLTRKSGHSERINAYLEKKNYKADDGRWSFVFSGAHGIDLVTFHGSDEVDLWSSGNVDARSTLPANFQVADCPPMDRAALVKIEFREKKYLVPGEIR